MTTTIGSLDLNALSDLYNDSNQYFWFEGDASATYGAGVHVTLSPDTSFVANPTGQNILMNTDGISIRNGLLPMMTLNNDSLDFNVIDTTTGTYNNVASFGSTTTVIGEEAKANMHLTFNNLSMVDKDGTKFFEVGDNRNADGIATVKHKETGYVYPDTGQAVVVVYSRILSIVSVYVDSVEVSSSNYSFKGQKVTINNLTPNTNIYVEITYTTLNPYFYLTFGNRVPSSEIGIYSVAEGKRVTASGYASHAEGTGTIASDQYSHAEGYETTASAGRAHAEGMYTTASSTDSHAEGYNTTADGAGSHAEGRGTTASGSSSHAEGSSTTASGNYSHAGGVWTVADGDYMTAIGKYNTLNSGKAFVIGNGTSNTARSDAFTVDWDGNTTMKGELSFDTATSAAATRANLGLTGVETRTLLWTNANPTNKFAAQKLKLNLSGYSAVEIQFAGVLEKCRVGEDAQAIFFGAMDSTSYPILRSRLYGVVANGIDFHDAIYKTSQQTTPNILNTLLIPLEIYGIKEV